MVNTLDFSKKYFLFLFHPSPKPERIDPSASRQGYDVRSDVWSLGITLVSTVSIYSQVNGVEMRQHKHSNM